MTDRTSPETETLIALDIKGEMARIKKLFDGVVGDKEDLISYAREVARLRGHAPTPDLEPVAYLHTLHMELGQTQRKLMWTESSPFGIPGKHYSAEYTVSCTPLFASPDTSTDRALK